MNKPVVYISGPISKIIDGNRQAFFDAQQLIESKGFEVLNPHDICSELRPRDYASPEEFWQACMKACIKCMMDADLCVLLPGFTDSRGAVMEASICRDLGIKTMSLEKFTEKHGGV